jgi:DNA-binding NarL/FixJ family response regulator
MSALHYYLSGPAFPAPARWREAFPAGLALDGPALIARLNDRAEAERLVWLSTADVQWQAHLLQVLQVRPAERVVLLSSAPNDREGLRAINDGARGYTHAYAVPELLQEVALVVRHGGLWVGTSLVQRLLNATREVLARLPDGPPPGAIADPAAAPAWACLSAREAQVARAVTAGLSNKEVAAVLNISERTVKAHLGAVFGKLGVRDRLQLVMRLSAAAVDADRATRSPG